jgi:hypothetical protein
VHVNVPNVYSFHRLLALEMGLIQSVFEISETEVAFGRHTRFDMRKLRALVEECGFRVVDSGSYYLKPFTHAQMDRIVEQGILGATFFDALERMTKYAPDLGCEIFVDLRITE